MSEKRTTNRREFLKGQAAAGELMDLADRATAGLTPETAPAAEQPFMTCFERQAMACQFEVMLNTAQDEHAAREAIAALDLVDELEEQLTVYRDSSEIMHVNRAAGHGPVRVESRLFDLLRRAVELSEATGGAFDITSGPLSKVWGFYRRAGNIPTQADLDAAMQRVGYRHLELNAADETVRFRIPEVEINLGAIGKGYALDRAAELLVEAGVHDFLLHGGQSSVLARGARAGDPVGWRVGVRHPLRPERRMAEIYVRDRALGTSGAGVQFFRHQGKRYGHILDPRTGWPAEGVFSVTVLAPSAAEADALATAFYVAGVAQALEYCRTHTGVGALILHPSESGSRVELSTAGLEEQDWRLLPSDENEENTG